MVGCKGLVQLGGVIQGFPRQDLIRFNACKSLMFTLKFPLLKKRTLSISVVTCLMASFFKLMNNLVFLRVLNVGSCKLQFPQVKFKMFELSHSSSKKGGCGKSLFPHSTLILNIRGLFEENPLMKNCGITLERGRNQT